MRRMNINRREVAALGEVRQLHATAISAVTRGSVFIRRCAASPGRLARLLLLAAGPKLSLTPRGRPSCDWPARVDNAGLSLSP